MNETFYFPCRLWTPKVMIDGVKLDINIVRLANLFNIRVRIWIRTTNLQIPSPSRLQTELLGWLIFPRIDCWRIA